jgi:hypothetical protein
VKNFAKHQNIKVKEKIKLKDKEVDTNNQEIQVNENSKDQMHDNKNNLIYLKCFSFFNRYIK